MCWHYIQLELQLSKCSDGTPPSWRTETANPCHPVMEILARGWIDPWAIEANFYEAKSSPSKLAGPGTHTDFIFLSYLKKIINYFWTQVPSFVFSFFRRQFAILRHIYQIQRLQYFIPIKGLSVCFYFNNVRKCVLMQTINPKSLFPNL